MVLMGAFLLAMTLRPLLTSGCGACAEEPACQFADLLAACASTVGCALTRAAKLEPGSDLQNPPVQTMASWFAARPDLGGAASEQLGHRSGSRSRGHADHAAAAGHQRRIRLRGGRPGERLRRPTVVERLRSQHRDSGGGPEQRGMEMPPCTTSVPRLATCNLVPPRCGVTEFATLRRSLDGCSSDAWAVFLRRGERNTAPCRTFGFPITNSRRTALR